LYAPARRSAPAQAQARADVKAGAEADADADAGAEAAPEADALPDVLGEVHVSFKVQTADKQVILTPMSHEWLKAGLESGEVDIKRADTSVKQIILEASTDDLRPFVLRFADYPNAFPGLARGGPGFEIRRTGRPRR